MTKRVALSFNFYVFREKLKYKCYINNSNYKLVNEFMTSKMCSNCGNINKELGSSNVYKCQICNIKMGRDHNGSRCIFLKSI